MKADITAMVTQMVGKSYWYATNVLKVIDFDFNDERERFYLFTDRRTEPYDRPYETAVEFLKEFHELPAETQVARTNANNPAAGLMIYGGTLSNQLKDILLDNITKVKENPGYIPQAEAIQANVDSIIDLAKVEVAFLATVTRANKNDGGF